MSFAQLPLKRAAQTLSSWQRAESCSSSNDALWHYLQQIPTSRKDGSISKPACITFPLPSTRGSWAGRTACRRGQTWPLSTPEWSRWVEAELVRFGREEDPAAMFCFIHRQGLRGEIQEGRMDWTDGPGQWQEVDMGGWHTINYKVLSPLLNGSLVVAISNCYFMINYVLCALLATGNRMSPTISMAGKKVVWS